MSCATELVGEGFSRIDIGARSAPDPGARSVGRTVSAGGKHAHHIADDFDGRALLTVALIVPPARLDAILDVDEHSFFKYRCAIFASLA